MKSDGALAEVADNHLKEYSEKHLKEFSANYNHLDTTKRYKLQQDLAAGICFSNIEDSQSIYQYFTEVESQNKTNIDKTLRSNLEKMAIQLSK